LGWLGNFWGYDTMFLKWVAFDYGLMTAIIAGPGVMALALYKIIKDGKCWVGSLQWSWKPGERQIEWIVGLVV
jgi:hypothetical protein